MGDLQRLDYLIIESYGGRTTAMADEMDTGKSVQDVGLQLAEILHLLVRRNAQSTCKGPMFAQHNACRIYTVKIKCFIEYSPTL